MNELLYNVLATSLWLFAATFCVQTITPSTCCENITCPTDSECLEGLLGFECVTTHQMWSPNSSLAYNRTRSNQTDLSSITFKIRTTTSSGNILLLSHEAQHIVLSVFTQDRRLGIACSNESVNLSFNLADASYDGWVYVNLTIQNADNSSTLRLTVANYTKDMCAFHEQPSLANDDKAILGATEGKPSIVGCIGDLFINGDPLPTFNTSNASDRDNIFTVSHVSDVDRGCNSSVMCSGGVNPCQNNATCVDIGVNTTCLCMQGFSGRFCQTRINPCDGEPCANNGTCRPSGVADYVCHCTEGYSGENCSQATCSNVTSCGPNGQCTTTSDSGTWRCNCSDGWTGAQCDSFPLLCNSSTCSSNGNCTQGIPKHVRCDCATMYIGDRCQFEDLCGMGWCGVHNCSMDHTTGWHNCTCLEGWTGENCTVSLPHTPAPIPMPRPPDETPVALIVCLTLLSLIIVAIILYILFRYVRNRRAFSGQYKPESQEYMGRALSLQQIAKPPEERLI